MENDEVKNLEDLVEFIVDWWHKEYDHLDFTSKCFSAHELRRRLANEVEKTLDRVLLNEGYCNDCDWRNGDGY